MTKEEYIQRLDAIKNSVFPKYGGFLYFLLSDVMNISALEKIVEQNGFTVKRSRYPDGIGMYSDVLKDGKIVGVISNQGLPSLEFFRRKRKYAVQLEGYPDFIEPIKGVHRILEWHTVRGKLHCLAGGETLLHMLPVEMPEERIVEILTRLGLIDRVEEIRENEKLQIAKLKEQQTGGGSAFMNSADKTIVVEKTPENL